MTKKDMDPSIQKRNTPLSKGRKQDVHKTLRRRSIKSTELLMYVQYTFYISKEC